MVDGLNHFLTALRLLFGNLGREKNSMKEIHCISANLKIWNEYSKFSCTTIRAPNLLQYFNFTIALISPSFATCYFVNIIYLAQPEYMKLIVVSLSLLFSLVSSAQFSVLCMVDAQ